MGEFRNIYKTMIKTEFMGGKGRGGYENFHLHWLRKFLIDFWEGMKICT